jgi:pyruvate,water dikinase
MSQSIVKSLNALRATDVAFSGGKGANLAELVAAGLPVPDAFVIGVPAYDNSVRTSLAASPNGGCDQLEPSGSVRDAIVASYEAMGDGVAVAVRSSAVAEDGATASFAGINETILNVTGTTELIAAIQQCWTSASSSRHNRYTEARGFDSGNAEIAVVVQRQIASTRAGVAFTVDPLSGNADRITIESARGLGEAVVSGLVTPDRIVVDKQTMNIVAYDRGSQDEIIEVATDAQGLVARAPTDDEAANPTLSDAQVKEIARYALRIEQWYGSPQDIEWAFDTQGKAWILQARPITTFDALAARAKADRLYDSSRSSESRWTRANLGEALPGVPTPLTWSLWSEGIDEAHWKAQIQLGVAPKRDDRRVPVVALAHGWPAISVDLVESQLAQIPGMDPNAFSQQFFGENAHTGRAPVGARVSTALRMVTHAPMALALLNRRLRAASAASEEAWRRDAWRPATDPVTLLTEAATRFRATMAVHTMQTYVCQALYQAVERAAGERVIDLVSGDGDLAEAHLASDLWRLSRGECSVEQFVKIYGFHGPNAGELASPSWRQDPEPVLRAAQEWADSIQARNPNESSALRRDKRREAEAHLVASLRQPGRLAVKRLLVLARRAVVAREIGKSAFLQDLDVARHAARVLGDDAVWHTLEELQAGVQLAPIDVVARQRVQTQLAATEPPLAFVGEPVVPTSGTAVGPDDEPESVIKGIGASPGRVRGRARVVTSSSAASVALGADDILIARTTDPSWVTTFMAAGGMAIDVGGALSHAAIIARELGIPCVIGTGYGTRAVADGAVVEIDGTEGTLRLIDSAPDIRTSSDSETISS